MDDSALLESHPGTNPSEFTANVIEVDSHSIRLDRTMFHAIGGGQPADHGSLITEGCEVAVLDVTGRGRIQHIIDVPDLSVGDAVLGRIDVDRRNTLSMMHTAQHLVSAHADLLWSAETVGNQIGTEKTRIDLRFPDRDAFNREALQEAVNESIKDGMPVTMDFRDRSELMEDPLVRVNMDRMPPSIDRWRVIEIGDLDRCPCAGTHVSSTAMIPAIEITKVKSKGAGKLRIEYSTN